MFTGATLDEIPARVRKEYERLSPLDKLPNYTYMIVRAQDRNLFKKAARSATMRHFLRASTSAPMLVCVSSANLQRLVDETLEIKEGGLLNWARPDLRTMVRSEWMGTPPSRLIGSRHLADTRTELKDFAQTVCGLLLPEPPWRAFFASAAGRTVVTMTDDDLGKWLLRDGYVEYEMPLGAKELMS